MDIQYLARQATSENLVYPFYVISSSMKTNAVHIPYSPFKLSKKERIPYQFQRRTVLVLLALVLRFPAKVTRLTYSIAKSFCVVIHLEILRSIVVNYLSRCI